MSNTPNNVDLKNLEQFSSLANTWWDPTGPLRTLHAINPLRLNFINQRCVIREKTVLDLGCGGGILTEALARQGAWMNGIDASRELITIATEHATSSDLTITYYNDTIESHLTEHACYYDVIVCMEMLEHVPYPDSIIAACNQALKPGGDLILSTLNRHPKAYLGAIIAAEYVLNWLPKRTHDYSQLITPAELCQSLRRYGLTPLALQGVGFNLLTSQFCLSSDVSINYMVHAIK